MKIYKQGDAVLLEASFYDADGNLADPTTVEAYVQDPMGTKTAVVISQVGVGKYQGTHDLGPNAAPGIWAWRITGSGAVERSAEGVFRVEKRLVQ